jgi:hypothetical protein
MTNPESKEPATKTATTQRNEKSVRSTPEKLKVRSGIRAGADRDTK